jgi:hypothetical protein
LDSGDRVEARRFIFATGSRKPSMPHVRMVFALSTRTKVTAFGRSWQVCDEGSGDEGVGVDIVGTVEDADLGTRSVAGGVRPALGCLGAEPAVGARGPPCWRGEAGEVPCSGKTVGDVVACGAPMHAEVHAAVHVGTPEH